MSEISADRSIVKMVKNVQDIVSRGTSFESNKVLKSFDIFYIEHDKRLAHHSPTGN